MKDKLLQAEGEELSRMLGEVLGNPNPLWMEDYARCTGAELTDTDPIPLTPAEAFKWRDWAIKNYSQKSWYEALFEVYKSAPLYHSGIIYEVWLEVYLTAEHYLKAAALCVLEGSKK